MRAALARHELAGRAEPELDSATWERERFLDRARALFTARLSFLTVGLLVLAIPAWRTAFGFTPLAFGGYFLVLLYSSANFLALAHPVLGRPVTYVTLCLDLALLVLGVFGLGTHQGLASPLLATQLVYTTLFALLFPRPLAVIPPLLTLTVVVRIDLLLDRDIGPFEFVMLIWYFALNLVIVYVLVSLSAQDTAARREVSALHRELRDYAVLEERNRLAREIHDGLGASLSSVIIQAEYLRQLVTEPDARDEVDELKGLAEGAIDELRRSLRMMRQDFELGPALRDYVRALNERHGLSIEFKETGRLTRRPAPETSLALFRILQEALSNAIRHASAAHISVGVDCADGRLVLAIQDDGRGFDPSVERPGHYGLGNLRERALKLGGELVLDSTPGKGTTVRVSIPLE